MSTQTMKATATINKPILSLTREDYFNSMKRAMAHLLLSTSTFPDMTPSERTYHRVQYNSIKRDIAKNLKVTYNEVDRCFKEATITHPFKSCWCNLVDLIGEV